MQTEIMKEYIFYKIGVIMLFYQDNFILLLPSISALDTSRQSQESQDYQSLEHPGVRNFHTVNCAYYYYYFYYYYYYYYSFTSFWLYK